MAKKSNQNTKTNNNAVRNSYSQNSKNSSKASYSSEPLPESSRPRKDGPGGES